MSKGFALSIKNLPLHTIISKQLPSGKKIERYVVNDGFLKGINHNYIFGKYLLKSDVVQVGDNIPLKTQQLFDLQSGTLLKKIIKAME